MADQPVTLETLLADAEALFGPSDSIRYQFLLGKTVGGWEFGVVNSWRKWIARGLMYEFRAATPTGAVAAFLDYVRVNGIDVRALAERGK